MKFTNLDVARTNDYSAHTVNNLIASSSYSQVKIRQYNYCSRYNRVHK
ncbi:MAG: hypothetical protein ACK4FV_07445 [Candidatus Nitrosocaldus sp.]